MTDRSIGRRACAVLLACASGLSLAHAAHAAQWQFDAFATMTNELPDRAGLAVDEEGFVHVQAFNRFPAQPVYGAMHAYSLDNAGRAPWHWTVLPADRRAGCGVYARDGQRLDCQRAASASPELPWLTLHAPQSTRRLWTVPLPAGTTVLDAGILDGDAALVAVASSNAAAPAGVYRVDANGYFLTTPGGACPVGTLTQSRLRAPTALDGAAVHFMACTGAGGNELRLARQGPWTRGWTTVASWPLGGATVLQMTLDQNGRGHALVRHPDGRRDLLVGAQTGGGWTPVPMPPTGLGASHLAADADTIAVAVLQATPTVYWIDVHTGAQRVSTHPGLSTLSVQGYQLTSTGALAIVGRLANLQPQLRVVDREGLHFVVADLPMAAGESILRTPHLATGPGNVAVVARTLVQSANGRIGVRVNQYDLPPRYVIGPAR